MRSMRSASTARYVAGRWQGGVSCAAILGMRVAMILCPDTRQSLPAAAKFRLNQAIRGIDGPEAAVYRDCDLDRHPARLPDGGASASAAAAGEPGRQHDRAH